MEDPIINNITEPLIEKPKFNQKVYTNQYYQDHKAYWFTKHECQDCGGKYLKANESRHRKTGKHLKGLQRKLDKIQMEVENKEFIDKEVDKLFDEVNKPEGEAKYYESCGLEKSELEKIDETT